MIDVELVIGVGNRSRRDDGAGPRVLDALRDRGCAAEFVEVAGNCARLLDIWDARRSIAVVDATQSGAAPGTIVRIDAMEQTVPTETFIHTSHAFGVAEAIETARALDRLPAGLIVWGIEGEDFGFGNTLSASVSSAVECVADEVVSTPPDGRNPPD